MNLQNSEYKYVDMALVAAFGDEYSNLNYDDKVNVLADFGSANISSGEYLSRIWVGNLQAYANTLRGDA